MFTYVAHFDRKGGIYIATKLFQFASHKEPYAILARLDDFFRPLSRHRVRPSYGDFLNSFVMKARGAVRGHMISLCNTRLSVLQYLNVDPAKV